MGEGEGGGGRGWGWKSYEFQSTYIISPSPSSPPTGGGEICRMSLLISKDVLENIYASPFERY